MNARDLYNNRPGRGSRTAYITTIVLGLLVGAVATSMNRQDPPANPTVIFGTAADTPTPSSSTPTPTPRPDEYIPDR